MRIHCQRPRCTPRSEVSVSGDIRLPLCDVRRGSLVRGYESAVVENAIFLLRSLYLPHEVRHWFNLHIEIYTASRGFLAIARLVILGPTKCSRTKDKSFAEKSGN